MGRWRHTHTQIFYLLVHSQVLAPASQGLALTSALWHGWQGPEHSALTCCLAGCFLQKASLNVQQQALSEAL